MVSRVLVVLMLLFGFRALGQDPSSNFDATIPDASVGQGGAEESQEMDEGRANTVCAQTRDCERGFTCTAGRCTYVGYRLATCHCGGSAGAIGFPMLLIWRLRRRRG